MDDLPAESEVSRALRYLAETDEKYARVRARVSAAEHECKVIKALAFLEAEGTVGERTARAESSQTYRAWIEDYENAVAEREILSAKRKRAELTVDIWRTAEASRRQGGI